MKKALALILALVLCLALGVPAFAAGIQDWHDGDFEPRNGEPVPNEAGDPYPYAMPNPAQGVAPEPSTDAHMNIIPEKDPVAPDYYYTVQEGDTLAAIAFAFYGDSNLSGALYTANENGHFLFTKGVLEAYRALRIPAVLGGTKRLDLRVNASYPYTPYYPVVTRDTRLYTGWYDVYADDGSVAYSVAYTYGPYNVDGGFVQPTSRHYQYIYICKAGDTLKSIANAWYGNDADPIINAIKNANPQMSNTTVTAGYYIILPIITIGY